MALNPKKLIIVGAGALCSALVVIMLLSAALGPKEPKEVASKDGMEVLVASKSMQPGAILDEKNARWEGWDEHKIYDGMITRKIGEDKKVEGKIKRPLVAGQPVTSESVVSDKDASMMTAQLKPGMRAVGVKVNAESSAGGFISPGDHVDVVLSHKIRPKNGTAEADMAIGLVDEDVSETILDNIQILAIDQTSEKNDSAKVGRTATLAVTPKQAEMLLLAEKMGDLSLTLRGLSDTAEATPEDAKAAREMTTDVQVSAILSRLHSQNQGGGGVKNVRIYNSVAVDSRVYAISQPAPQAPQPN